MRRPEAASRERGYGVLRDVPDLPYLYITGAEMSAKKADNEGEGA